MRYFSSDWHINHRNVINYCKRPFILVEDMNIALIQYLNDTLKPGDEMFFVGDLALNKKWSKWLFENFKVPGVTWHMIPGNHDDCFSFPGSGQERKERMLQKYLSDGWATVDQTLNLTLKDGTNVLLSHLPYGSKNGAMYDARYMEVRPKDEGMILVHGHLHGKYKKFGRMIDVGLDAHDFKLLTEDELIAIIKDSRDFIPSPLTEWYKEREANEEAMANERLAKMLAEDLTGRYK